MLSQPENLKSLGSQNTVYTYEGVDKGLLERFPNPMISRVERDFTIHGTSIEITAPEFTSLCPKTGQPDYATIVVVYTPRDFCVESKSYKMYLNTFRQTGEFHEACVQRIFDDLWELLEPRALLVQGQFTPRGGIKFWPTVERVSE